MKKFTQVLLIFFLSVLFLSGCSQPETQIQSSGNNNAGDINIDGQISEDEYRYFLQDSTTGLDVYWSNDDINIYMRIEHPSEVWVAVAFDPSFAMKEANIILMTLSDGQAKVRDDYGTGNFTHQEDLQLDGTSDLGEAAAASGIF